MERGDKPWLLESQESSYHLWLNTFNRCGFFCPQNVSILWWSSRQSHSTKTGFTPPKNKCSLICHHVNPARSPSDTTARKAACQRLKQCYSNITLECLHTSGISHTHTHTHTHTLPGNSLLLSHVRLVVRGREQAQEDALAHHCHGLPIHIRCPQPNRVPDNWQMVTDTRDMYDKVTGNWAMDSGTSCSLYSLKFSVQHHLSFASLWGAPPETVIKLFT